MKWLLGIIVAIVAISCETDNVEPVDFGQFTIQIPATWTPIAQPGYDSFVGQIEINEKERVFFDLGWYSNPLDVDPATHDTNFAIIDGKRAKIVNPKNFGQGTTGIYFDSLEITKTTKFQMNGAGLSSINQKLLLTAFESLQFEH